MNLFIENLTNSEVLGLTIIGEARGEPIESQVGVGSVIRNRLILNLKKYKTYNDVCLEPKQFGCWNTNDPNQAYLVELAEQLFNGQLITDPYLRQCFFVGKGIEEWSLVDNTKGATNYLEHDFFNNHRPTWARNAKNVVIRGHHIFFSIV